MTRQFLTQSSLEESTISRQARNAFAFAVVFTVAAFINLVISFQISLLTKTVVSIVDTIVVFAFMSSAIISARLIRKRQKEKGVGLLLGSFILTLALRNALIADLGTILGVFTVIVVPFIGLLTLNSRFFNRALAFGILSGSFYLIFDILVSRYLPPYRQSIGNVDTLARGITIISAIVALVFIVALFRQHRFLLLSSKLTLSMVFMVLFPIVTLNITSSLSLENTLISRQDKNLQVKALLVAQSIDRFIETNKIMLQADGETSALINYLSYLQGFETNEKFNPQNLKEQALENLHSFKRRNILHIDSYAILDLSGKNVLDTTPENVGKDESEEKYFTETLQTGLPFVSDILRSDNDEYFLYFSAPIRILKVDEKSSVEGSKVGVIRVRYNLSVLEEYINDYVNTEGANKTNIFAALLSEKKVKQISLDDPPSVYLVLANSKNKAMNLMSVTPLTTNVITPLQMNHILPVGSTAQLSLEVPGFDEGLRNRSENPIFKARAYPRDSGLKTDIDIIATAEIEEKSLPWTVVVSQDFISFNAPYQRQNDTNIVLAIIIAVGAAILAYFGSQYLTKPILRFAETADRVAKGDLEARVEIISEDEIGALGIAFNSMTDQLNTLITTLANRVAERTQALERSTQQLRAAVKVGNAAASLRSIDELLSQTAELISEEFGFYHAGIFLVDSYGRYAHLRAANSEGGRRMLARAHKLEVGAEGIVGYVTATGEARIALDVGQDAIFFNNPDLPQTRSEMALPLIAGGKILGALDIQSKKGGAFTRADIATLQILADQIAIAIENAHLFEENRKALVTIQRAYGEQSHLGWNEFLYKKKNYGYRSSIDGSIYPLEKEVDEGLKQTMQKSQIMLEENKLTAHIPIMVRGKPVGAIRLSKPDKAQSWDQRDLDLAKTLTEELSQAMDSARLFEETRQQADRERLIGDISNRMQETMNVESVVRLAADELYKLLELDQITIHFRPEDNQEKEEIV